MLHPDLQASQGPCKHLSLTGLCAIPSCHQVEMSLTKQNMIDLLIWLGIVILMSKNACIIVVIDQRSLV